MAQIINNQWGISEGLEAQRSDLWRLDLSAATSYFNSIDPAIFVAAGLNKSNLPNATTASFYASRISLPIQKITPRKVIQGTVPKMMPSYFDASDAVRIDFIHDSSESALYTLLQIWRLITRIGRDNKGVEPIMLLPTSTFKPQFKFDVVVSLLNGSDSETDSETGLEYGAQYTLVNCWPRSIQQAALDKSAKASAHSISAQLQIQEIVS